MSGTHSPAAVVALPTKSDASSGMSVEPLKTVYKDAHLTVNRVATQDGTGPLFANNGNIQFDLRGLSVCFAKRVLIELNIHNNHATAAATLINAPFLFNQIQLYCNGGSNSVCNLYPEEQWFAHLPLLDQEKTTEQAALQNWNYGDPATYASWYTSEGVTIAAGTASKVYIELDCVLNQCRIPLRESVANYWRVQPYFTSSPLTRNSAMTIVSDLSITSAFLYVLGEEISSRSEQQLITQMRSGRHAFHNYTGIRAVLPLGPMASGTQIQQTMTAFNGQYSSLIGFIRAQNATQEERYQFNHTTPSTPIMYAQDNLAILDGSGGPIWINNVPEKIVRLAIARYYSDSTFASTFRAYPFHTTDFPTDSFEKGLICHRPVQSNWSWQSTLTSTAGANCELVIIGMQYTETVIHPDKSVVVKFKGL